MMRGGRRPDLLLVWHVKTIPLMKYMGFIEVRDFRRGYSTEIPVTKEWLVNFLKAMQLEEIRGKKEDSNIGDYTGWAMSEEEFKEKWR